MSKAYKLFRIKNGKLYPMFVFANEETVIGKWIPAKNGPLTKDGKVKSKLGGLCYRPGWHLTEIPLANHIGVKRNGVIVGMHPDTVWCEVEYSDEIDYNSAAKENGTINGKYNSRLAYLKEIPRNGFYWFTTNPMAEVRWLITGEIKVLRILDDKEVENICKNAGYEPQKRIVA